MNLGVFGLFEFSKKWQKVKFDFATFLNYNAVYEYERRKKRTNWYVEVLAQCCCGIVFSDICVFGYTYQRVGKLVDYNQLSSSRGFVCIRCCFDFTH